MVRTYFDGRHPTIILEFVVASICDKTTYLLFAASWAYCDKGVLEEILELPKVIMIFGDIKVSEVSTSQEYK